MGFDDLVDAYEAGRLLGYHVNTVRRMAARGKLPGYKRKYKWMFDIKQLEQWVRSQDNGVPVPEPALRDPGEEDFPE